MSVIRSSSVGCLTEGRMSHQIWVASCTARCRPGPRAVAAIRASSPNVSGEPERGRSSEIGGADRLEAGILAAPERRAGRQRQQVRQEVADLVHQVDAQVLVLDRGMDVHAADHLAPGQQPEVVGQRLVALLLGAALVGPGRDGVGRGGDDRHAVLARRCRPPCRAAGPARCGRRRCPGRRGCRPRPAPAAARGVTCSPSARWQAGMKPGSGAATSSRVVGSTRRYSSSMPSERAGFAQVTVGPPDCRRLVTADHSYRLRTGPGGSLARQSERGGWIAWRQEIRPPARIEIVAVNDAVEAGIRQGRAQGARGRCRHSGRRLRSWRSRPGGSRT